MIEFFSESGQDRFVFEQFFRGKRGGVFVDVGAYDGATRNNTLFFESSLGWRGLCVEPSSTAFERLQKRRRCACEPVTDFSNLSALLEKHALHEVDYGSVDAAGAELGVLSEWDFARFKVKVFTVARSGNDEHVLALMAERGHERVAQIGRTFVFRRREVPRLPLTTVICAVWHRDADRERLLAAHAANLDRQSVPVERIYVFDGGDVPNPSLPGRKIVAHESLTIYQAWNVALSLVETALVMNLNLDDRLAPNGVEHLQAALGQENASLAGGDWKICYSQEATDAVEPCYPAARVPFVPDWPPRNGVATRLGSGTGERGTYGPAVMWRLDTHIGAPRYTWRLPEGTLLKTAADAGWWRIVKHHLGKKAIRVPLVIGHYHSHPAGQAEFRGPPEEERLMSELGVSLL